MRNLIIVLFLAFTSNVFSQTENDIKSYFLTIKNILSKEETFAKVSSKFDSLVKSYPKDYRCYVSIYLDRELDMTYRHKRIKLKIDNLENQIDLLVLNDTIYYCSSKADGYKKKYRILKFKNNIDSFLRLRNANYNSKKTRNDLIKELTLDIPFAIMCGEAMGYTEYGSQVRKFVNNEDIQSLNKLLKSFSCEIQSFGVEGFRQLEEKGVLIPDEPTVLIDRIKKRNSEVQICRGCIIGQVEKIY